MYKQLDSIVAAQVKQKIAACGGGTACTDAVAFKGRMGNSEMQMGLILITPGSLLETRQLKGRSS